MRARAYVLRRREPDGFARRPAAEQAGFTLIELLVVLVILVILASLVAPRVIGYLGSSRTKAAKVQIQSLSTALELYKVDTGRYPTTTEGLKALVVAPPDATSWNGPYLTKKDVPSDPWGRPYTYRSPGELPSTSHPWARTISPAGRAKTRISRAGRALPIGLITPSPACASRAILTLPSMTVSPFGKLAYGACSVSCQAFRGQLQATDPRPW
jgi:general secretion pathway protein G